MSSGTVTHNDEAKDTSPTSLTYEQRAALERKNKRVITLKDGRKRRYTPPGTFNHGLIITHAKQVYYQLKELGQNKVTLRTWHYNLEDIEELNLRVSEDPYKLLSKIFVKARMGKYGEEYKMPHSWFIDKKRTAPPERPWQTPQQFVDDLLGRIRYHIQVYPLPRFYNQNKYYICILVEKDTLLIPVQQLVKKIFGGKPGDENQIPVYDCGGFDSHTHLRTLYRVLKKHQKIGRKILIFYIGDWDPSGLGIEASQKKKLREMGLDNFELKRIAVTKQQVKDLKMFKAKDPQTMAKLLKDSRHKEFMKLNDDELFQTESDQMLKAVGLKELKRIIERDIIKEYWDRKIWEKYEDIFTATKVQKRLVQGIGQITTEILGDSEIEDAINEALDDLVPEEDELIEIEGDGYTEPINEEEFEVPEDEEDVELE